MAISRRDFIKVTSGLAIGLMFEINCTLAKGNKPLSEFRPNVWLKISPDNVITIVVAKAEMGQGVRTSLATLVAEEMEADWSKVVVETAKLDTDRFGDQQTGGSSSVRTSWLNLRQAGACAREMLLSAASKVWNVDTNECRAENGAIVHRETHRILTYGVLASLASTLPVPENVKLKNPADFKLIGKSVKRVDNPKIVSGKLKYGIDERIEGMIYATLIKPPGFTGSFKQFSLKPGENDAGIITTFPVNRSLAVVADNTWRAINFRNKIDIEWYPGENADITSEQLLNFFKERSKSDGIPALREGIPFDSVEGTRIQADYFVPFVAHAAMEPLNCVIDLTAKSCEIWVSTQAPEEVQKVAAEISGLNLNDITVHISTIGGSFGRRLEVDYVREAMEIALKIRRPFQFVLSREEDLRHDFYRPASFHTMRAVISNDGKLTAWNHKVTAPSIIKQRWNDLQKTHGDWLTKEGLDETVMLGANDIPYSIPNLDVSYVMANTIVPISWWRGTYDSLNAFAKECFVDEIAYAMRKDPMLLRLELLASHERCSAVLKLLAEKSDWFNPLKNGTFKGMAIHTTFGVPVGHVVALNVIDKSIKIIKVTSVIDCGFAVNPDMVKAQIEGSVMDGLATSLKSEINIEKSGVKQKNFNDYSLLRIKDAPIIEVHIVPGGKEPRGVGEPGVAPVAPAVANALFAATGKRFRNLPIKL